MNQRYIHTNISFLVLLHLINLIYVELFLDVWSESGLIFKWQDSHFHKITQLYIEFIFFGDVFLDNEKIPVCSHTQRIFNVVIFNVVIFKLWNQAEVFFLIPLIFWIVGRFQLFCLYNSNLDKISYCWIVSLNSCK